MYALGRKAQKQQQRGFRNMTTAITVYLKSLGNDIWNYIVFSGNKHIGGGISNSFTYDDLSKMFCTSGMTWENVNDIVFDF